MKNKVIPSEKTQQEAISIAKATQKQGQTKEQTKVITQGIEKGIALYKKQQKDKARQTDKAKKKTQKTKQIEQVNNDHSDQIQTTTVTQNKSALIPWVLLVISWIGFFVYVSQTI